jgi:hypothetical protein
MYLRNIINVNFNRNFKPLCCRFATRSGGDSRAVGKQRSKAQRLLHLGSNSFVVIVVVIIIIIKGYAVLCLAFPDPFVS